MTNSNRVLFSDLMNVGISYAERDLQLREWLGMVGPDEQAALDAWRKDQMVGAMFDIVAASAVARQTGGTGLETWSLLNADAMIQGRTGTVDTVSYFGTAYRGQYSGSQIVFMEGLAGKGNEADLSKHINTSMDSIYVPTTLNFDVAARFATTNFQIAGNVYAVDVRGGLYLNNIPELRNAHPEDMEIAVPYRVPSYWIKGVTPVDENGNPRGYSLINPSYRRGVSGN